MGNSTSSEPPSRTPSFRKNQSVKKATQSIEEPKEDAVENVGNDQEESENVEEKDPTESTDEKHIDDATDEDKRSFQMLRKLSFRKKASNKKATQSAQEQKNAAKNEENNQEASAPDMQAEESNSTDLKPEGDTTDDKGSFQMLRKLSFRKKASVKKAAQEQNNMAKKEENAPEAPAAAESNEKKLKESTNDEQLSFQLLRKLSFRKKASVRKSKENTKSEKEVETKNRDNDETPSASEVQDKDNVGCVETNAEKVSSAYHLLPELILIQIFSFLSSSEKCMAAMVCKSWNTAVHNKNLWTSFSLPFNKSLRLFNNRLQRLVPSNLSTFIKTYIGEKLLTCAWDNIPQSAMVHLKQRCPNLMSLSITNYIGCYGTCNTDHRQLLEGCATVAQVDLSNLPITLKELQLKLDFGSLTSTSSFPYDTSALFFVYFENLSQNTLPNLKKLSLHEAQIEDDDISKISKFTALTYLHLEGGIFSIFDTAMNMTANLFQALSQLTHLEFLTDLCGDDFTYVDLANALKQHALNLSHLKISVPQFNLNPDLADFQSGLEILATIATLEVYAIGVEYSSSIDVLRIIEGLPQNCRLMLNVCRGYKHSVGTMKAAMYRPDIEITFLNNYWREFAALPIKEEILGLQLDF